jgi:hypothetical protein
MNQARDLQLAGCQRELIDCLVSTPSGCRWKGQTPGIINLRRNRRIQPVSISSSTPKTYFRRRVLTLEDKDAPIFSLIHRAAGAWDTLL